MHVSRITVPTAAVALAFLALPVYADHSSPGASPEARAAMEDAAHGACAIADALSFGSRGSEVECLQHALIDGGFLSLAAPTGYFGALTKAALAEWQEHQGLPGTGFFGALSRAAFGRSEEAAAPAAHAHEPVDVSAWPSAPSVSIALHQDAMSGWNLEIQTQNFRFAPEHVNGAVAANEGHAHLYVNGKKIGRLYGAWQHLPADLFSSGSNEVVVTLNANDHSDLASGGKRIEASEKVSK